MGPWREKVVEEMSHARCIDYHGRNVSWDVRVLRSIAMVSMMQGVQPEEVSCVKYRTAAIPAYSRHIIM